MIHLGMGDPWHGVVNNILWEMVVVVQHKPWYVQSCLGGCNTNRGMCSPVCLGGCNTDRGMCSPVCLGGCNTDRGMCSPVCLGGCNADHVMCCPCLSVDGGGTQTLEWPILFLCGEGCNTDRGMCGPACLVGMTWTNISLTRIHSSKCYVHLRLTQASILHQPS